MCLYEVCVLGLCRLGVDVGSAAAPPSPFAVLAQTPGTVEAGILERAYPLMKGGHHWLVLPASDNPREVELLSARAVSTWLRQHLPQVEGTQQT